MGFGSENNETWLLVGRRPKCPGGKGWWVALGQGPVTRPGPPHCRRAVEGASGAARRSSDPGAIATNSHSPALCLRSWCLVWSSIFPEKSVLVQTINQSHRTCDRRPGGTRVSAFLDTLSRGAVLSWGKRDGILSKNNSLCIHLSEIPWEKSQILSGKSPSPC